MESLINILEFVTPSLPQEKLDELRALGLAPPYAHTNKNGEFHAFQGNLVLITRRPHPVILREDGIRISGIELRLSKKDALSRTLEIYKLPEEEARKLYGACAYSWLQELKEAAA